MKNLTIFKIHYKITSKINSMWGVLMKKCNRFSILIAIVTIAATIAAAVATAIVYFEKKKKDEEELQEYLDNSII